MKGSALLSKRGIPFVQKNASVSPDDAADLKKANGGEMSIPLVLIGNLKTAGFSEEQWNGLLDTAGYPRTPLRATKPTILAAPVKPAATPSAPAATPTEPAAPPATQ